MYFVSIIASVFISRSNSDLSGPAPKVASSQDRRGAFYDKDMLANKWFNTKYFSLLTFEAKVFFFFYLFIFFSGLC